MASKNQVWYSLEQKAIVILGFFVLLVFLYSFNIISWTVPCVFKHFFAIECLGCGTTTAIKLVFQGQVTESLNLNPLGLLLVSYLGIRIVQIVYNKLLQK